MTAEIAILNKTAVALAADSAVTISAGNREEKIFDSADKLFELSYHNPIGIMIYNGTSFAEIPLPNLIKKFRSNLCSLSTVEEAADRFLSFLDEIGRDTPKPVLRDVLASSVRPLLKLIQKRYSKKFDELFSGPFPPDIKTPEDVRSKLSDIVKSEIDNFRSVIDNSQDATFFGSGQISFDSETDDVLVECIEQEWTGDHGQQNSALELLRLFLKKDFLSGNLTGIVIAGFGSGELFPTLISYEIDGMICGRLKYVRRNHVDIDRAGKRASVIPFAQKEMVERFLYGLDESISDNIVSFVENSVTDIRKSILDRLSFQDNSERDALEGEVAVAEAAFIDGLKTSAFEGIRTQSQLEIEDMVEFMPKPELAKMAEALVNLTSIKRRVSRGMETVGGPIDVAVISQSEGFVWVKRKHYFPAELNARYFERVRGQTGASRELTDGSNAKPGEAGSKGRKARGPGRGK